MKYVRALPLAILAATPLAAQDNPDEGSLTSRYTPIGDCVEVFNGMPVHDVGLLKCEGLGEIPVWWRFAEGTRINLGFGEREHATGTFGPDRDGAWPIEWRGIEREGLFEPFAVIARMTFPTLDGPTDSKSFLFVFRLRDDGTSCLIGSSLSSNEEARALADSALEDFECLYEPMLFEEAAQASQPQELTPEQVAEIEANCDLPNGTLTVGATIPVDLSRIACAVQGAKERGVAIGFISNPIDPNN